MKNKRNFWKGFFYVLLGIIMIVGIFLSVRILNNDNVIFTKNEGLLLIFGLGMTVAQGIKFIIVGSVNMTRKK